MISRRDFHIMKEMFQSVVEVGKSVNDPSTITFHLFTRTDDGSQVARYLDNAAYDLNDSDQGYTATETSYIIPCKVIPNVHTYRLTDMGYNEDSELEIEISSRDLQAHGVKIYDIKHRFEYVTIDATNDMGLQGRAKSTKEQLWEVSSVRPLVITGGKEVYAVRVGLQLIETDTSSLSYAAVGV